MASYSSKRRMAFWQTELTVATRGRGFYPLDHEHARAVAGSGMSAGSCQLFSRHTSTSLIICENADGQVLHDLENYMARLVKDGDPLFKHTAEGPDDMPAHVRSVLTQTSLQIPVVERSLALGTRHSALGTRHSARGKGCSCGSIEPGHITAR